jgi:hypothetical protein
VLVCTRLHNSLHKECRSKLFLAESELDNEDYKEENLKGDFLTQDEQSWEDANDWRAEIANYMWVDSRTSELEPNPQLIDEGNNNEVE